MNYLMGSPGDRMAIRVRNGYEFEEVVARVVEVDHAGGLMILEFDHTVTGDPVRITVDAMGFLR